MSVYSSVESAFDDGPDASPYVDVAHDNGGYDKPGGCVRLIVGEDMDHAAHTYLSPADALSLGLMLIGASQTVRGLLDEELT